MRILPDRRELTDEMIIGPTEPGQPLERVERFRRTAEYRRLHPGGMAEALASLRAGAGDTPVFFDGLRGEAEVRFALRYSGVRFVELSAPDDVRVRRLLGRADDFDGPLVTSGAIDSVDARQLLDEIEGIREVFSAPQLEWMAALSNDGFSAVDIAAKVSIVVAERRNYDPAAASAILATLPEQRALRLDSSVLAATQVSQAVLAWL